MPITIDLSSPIHADFLRIRLRKILRELNVRSAIWSITLVGDKEMCDLHKRTMSLDTTTDVLTFDLRDAPRSGNQKPKIKNQKSPEGCPVEVDTVICLDEARRRAKDLGHPIEHELLLYAVHSLLHVQGYDDATPKGGARMHAREDELLVAVGVGPVYAGVKTPAARNEKTRIPSPPSPTPRSRA